MVVTYDQPGAIPGVANGRIVSVGSTEQSRVNAHAGAAGFKTLMEVNTDSFGAITQTQASNDTPSPTAATTSFPTLGPTSAALDTSPSYGIWIGILAGLLAMLGLVYGVSRWIGKQTHVLAVDGDMHVPEIVYRPEPVVSYNATPPVDDPRSLIGGYVVVPRPEAVASYRAAPSADNNRAAIIGGDDVARRSEVLTSYSARPPNQTPPTMLDECDVVPLREAVASPSVTPPVDTRPALFGGYDVVKAVLEVAHNLAQQSQFPGVCEAATLVSTLVNIISENRSNIADAQSWLNRCHLLITMLQRAAKVLEKIDNIEDTDSSRELKRMLIQNVQDAIGNMVDLVKTYRSKRRITQVVVSASFRRRMEEAEAVINQTFDDMVRWLQIDLAQHQSRGRRNSSANGLSVTASDEDTEEGRHREQQPPELLLAELTADNRRLRRQRNLNEIEIPDDQVTISGEVLGKGGFGVVYIADYDGVNAAAKVIQIDHVNPSRSGRADDDDSKEVDKGEADEGRQRASALLELQAMIQLRSPHTVNVYGAITSRRDRVVLVMELLTGGDLRSLLKQSAERLPDVQARRIIGDICAGLVFLHSKNAIHGDIKSSNVLLDGDGRAKIGDFGTSRWAQHSDCTGLATYQTSQGGIMHMISFAWAAPEVLNSKGTSYASDVYSFGIVAWEVLSMKVPWAKAFPLDIYQRVVFKGDRPEMPAYAPGDIASIVCACWAGEPEERPTSSEIRDKLRARESQK